VAQSYAHKFGQIIGGVLESAVEPMLRDLAEKHGLYLDVKGKRKARKGRKKITWLDLYGNSHDLDFVLERGGSDEHNGTPVAFIEAAWRRYTKHSRNKAQEIQGAIAPLLTKYRDAAPFAGVILAGEYTADSLKQLESLGFKLLHFSYHYHNVVRVFGKYGIDASSDESTPEADFADKVEAWEGLSPNDHARLAKDLASSDKKAVDTFIRSVEAAITRYIVLVRVLPLHGNPKELDTVGKAIDFIASYARKASVSGFMKYEIEIRYNNGDKIVAEFKDKDVAIKFLRANEEPYRPAAQARNRGPGNK
jgi:hypothetical protein